MRFRLIGVLAALLMLAPAAGFAMTSPVRQDQSAQTTQKTKKKSKTKKMKHSKKSKKSKK